MLKADEHPSAADPTPARSSFSPGAGAAEAAAAGASAAAALPFSAGAGAAAAAAPFEAGSGAAGGGAGALPEIALGLGTAESLAASLASCWRYSCAARDVYCKRLHTENFSADFPGWIPQIWPWITY